MKKAWASAWFPPVALMILAVVTRLPWLSRVLYDFDSVAFAFALEAFDVSRHSPHPPGYLFYVGVGKLLNGLLGDPNRAFVWASVLAGAAGVGCMTVLGRRLLPPRTALLAAGLLLTSPLFWTFTEVCAPYVFGALFSILTAALVLEGLHGRGPGFFVAAAAVAALGSGFRPELLLVVGPLPLFFALRAGWKPFLAAAVACVGGLALWLVPTVLLSGGWGPYLAAVDVQAHAVWNQGVAVNLAKLLVYGAWALGAGCVLLPLLPCSLVGLGRQERRFFLLWMIPYTLLTVFVAFGQPGMLLVFLPPLILLLARGCAVALERLRERAGSRSAATGRLLRWGPLLVALALFGGNGWIFACAPGLSPRGLVDDHGSFADKVRAEFFLLTGRGIRFTDRYRTEVFSAVRSRFDPEDTLIFTNFKGWVFARYYLRPFPVHNYFCFYGLKDGKSYYVPEGRFAVPADVKQIVLYDDDRHSIHFHDSLAAHNRSGESTETIRTPGGFVLRVLRVEGGQRVLFRPEGFLLQ